MSVRKWKGKHKKKKEKNDVGMNNTTGHLINTQHFQNI
jgi:hypothetical protein